MPPVVEGGHAKKAATGIAGFDGITGGGLPRGRASFVVGGPGSGKTVFAMQSLVYGASQADEPGLFVGFEERTADLCSNFSAFNWDIDGLVAAGKLAFIDARLSPGTVISGQFDITGLLAVIAARAAQMGAKRVVIDGIDVLVSMLNDRREEMRQVFEIDQWLRETGMTGILTGKLDGELAGGRYDPVQYVVDCVVLFGHRVEGRLATRDVRVAKYRGSDFSGNRYPMVICETGVEVLHEGETILHHIHEDRVSSGIGRLDVMLGGGYYRGSSMLFSGAPGTAKTTIAAAMVAATCARGERAVFISFDEAAEQIVRNLRSVGIDLATHIASGLLVVVGLRATAVSAESHIHRVRSLITAHRTDIIVIDPVSALIKSGGVTVADAVIHNILDFAKIRGITAVLTSLVDGDNPEREVTETHISTMADTWLHLSYLVRGGERNRALTIIKSRGSAHSNQVRELVLSSEGLTLTDVYTAGGDVLMGTARMERESAELEAAAAQAREAERRRGEVATSIATLRGQLGLLESELASKQAEFGRIEGTEQSRQSSIVDRHRAIQHSRSADGNVTAIEG